MRLLRIGGGIDNVRTSVELPRDGKQIYNVVQTLSRPELASARFVGSFNGEMQGGNGQ